VGKLGQMRALFAALLCVLAGLLAGCQTDATSSLSPAAAAPTLTVQDPDATKYFPSDEPLHLATEYFDRGDFGTAAKYYEDAVTRAPKDASAWIGLAASYDRIGRFDLADRAYNQAVHLVGETTQILNNEGYSYMLRGRYVDARRKLQAAHRREPDNTIVNNNLKLLDMSSKSVRRVDQN
jgi:Flp pilus assembly protein TadD